MQINLLDVMDEGKCYKMLRQVHWSEGVYCMHCDSKVVVKNGHDEGHPDKQRYQCNDCHRNFDDLTDTVFSGSNKSLKVWVAALYLMGLNLSNRQLAKELDISEPTAQRMTTLLREGIVKKVLTDGVTSGKKPDKQLEHTIDIDEVYIVAGHKGQPKNVLKAGRPSRPRRLRGAPGRDTLASENLPYWGWSSEVALWYYGSWKTFG